MAPSAPEEQTGPQVDPAAPIIFVGLADGADFKDSGTPVEAQTLFQLARVKPHFCFPAILRQTFWCFLVHSDAMFANRRLRVQILNSAGKEQGKVDFASTDIQAVPAGTRETSGVQPMGTAEASTTRSVCFLDRGQWIVQAIPIPDLLIQEPGEYQLILHADAVTCFLGRVIFAFVPPPELSDERVSALEADPLSPKAVGLTLGCKHCDSKLKVYAAVRKIPDQEEKGFTFYREVQDRFTCVCGHSDMTLKYLRTAMHGFLGRHARASFGEISYLQRYANSHLLDIAGKFLALIQKEKKEEVVQAFLEANKVLFARFHARRLFVKPRILGKFNADFAILDSEGVLTLIEIERPTLRLFKKNGHLRSGLNHAYEQVQDWLNEVGKHKFAVIEGLDLKPDDVLSVRGCVIAGRAKSESREHLRRHMSQPRPGIEFATLDMLGQSLVRIAHDLHGSSN